MKQANAGRSEWRDVHQLDHPQRTRLEAALQRAEDSRREALRGTGHRAGVGRTTREVAVRGL